MVALYSLSHLIARLQSGTPVVQGRRMLLSYAREKSGAHHALIFALDAERQTLVLWECSAPSLASLHPPLLTTLPLNGLFASALDTQAFLDIPRIAGHPLSLPEELLWTGDAGHVVLHALREGSQHQAVLILCFGLEDAVQLPDDLPICISLLSAYLSQEEDASSFQGERITKTSRQAEGAYVSPLISYSEQQSIIDQERHRIAREIHDGPAQSIAHVIHRLDYALQIFAEQPRQALAEVRHTRDILAESLEDLRRGIASLMPAPLEELEFAVALETLIKEYRMDGLHITYDADDLSRWPEALKAPVYRFVQEALNNVRKHAQATRIIVRLRIFSDQAVVQVNDNGRGFVMERAERSAPVLAAHRKGSPGGEESDGNKEDKEGRQIHASIASGFGLRTMEERIRQAGGSLEISSRPGAGTTVKARFPLARQSGLLTRREQEVLTLLVDGATNRTIAEKLSISVETVKSHVHHIMQKMQVKDRTQAAVMATRQHWL